MKPTLIVLCHHHNGALRTFAARNPHANIPHLRRDLWNGCCRYWLKRGVPKDWWNL